jgi:heat shock protein HslJ
MKLLIVSLLAAISGSAIATGSDTGPLGLTRLQNSAYAGFESIKGKVQLHAGKWEGEPPQPGSASVPRVDFLGDLVARGDLNGDGRDEAAVVLTTNYGGSGVFFYVAVVARNGEENRNIATRGIGDRVQVRGLRIEEHRLLVDLVRAGAKDASCCPTEVVTLAFRLKGGRLTTPVQVGPSATLSPQLLAGRRWRLTSWKFGEPTQGHLTLAYIDGRFLGSTGCNEYSAAVKAADAIGSIAVGPATSTRKQCGPEVMSEDQRFLGLLPSVNRFWFHAGQLALDYGAGEQSGVMFLEREN